MTNREHKIIFACIVAWGIGNWHVGQHLKPDRTSLSGDRVAFDCPVGYMPNIEGPFDPVTASYAAGRQSISCELIQDSTFHELVVPREWLEPGK